jgi:hypothetical protein
MISNPTHCGIDATKLLTINYELSTNTGVIRARQKGKTTSVQAVVGRRATIKIGQSISANTYAYAA